MNRDDDILTEYNIVTDEWKVKEYDNEDDALRELGKNAHALFIYRTFLIKEKIGRSTTGEIQFLQDVKGDWDHVLSFNNWRIEGLDTRGLPFKFKDPKGEIKQADGSQEELEKDYGIKWPHGTSYTCYIAKILFTLSKFNNWDEYELSNS